MYRHNRMLYYNMNKNTQNTESTAKQQHQILTYLTELKTILEIVKSKGTLND